MRLRLDAKLVALHLSPTRSQAENTIKLGDVSVNGQVVVRPGYFVTDKDTIKLIERQRYVSRAGLKLASVAEVLHIIFRDKVVLDVGSSTGGFTDYALRNGAAKVIAVDVGTEQLHSSLRANPKIELHEKTDIRDYVPNTGIDIVVIDVSFISLRKILPHISKTISPNTEVIAMLKPQFEAGRNQVNKGIVKNESVRRKILHDFENWLKQYFIIQGKRDSDVVGAKGNQERFYKLCTLS